MNVKKLRQVFVVATDLDATLRFYRDTLGLPLQFRDGDRWIQLQCGDVSFALASAAEGQGAPAGVPVPVLEVVDLDTAIAELLAAGSACGNIRDMGSHGRTAMIMDPSGARLVLFQRAAT